MMTAELFKMRFTNHLILLSGLCFFHILAFAQNQPVNDSLRIDSVRRATEKLLVEQQQRQLFDSVIRTELQTELQKATGDKQKTKALEEKIRKTAVTDSIHKAEQLQKIAELKLHAKGYPVAPFNDTLFFIYTRIGSFNAQDRAAAISRRIVYLYQSPAYVADSLKINENEGNYDLLYNNSMVVLSVTRLDGMWSGKDGKEANQQATIYSQLHQHIQDCCNEAGIEILSPHYRSARNGNMTTIPVQYLSKEYKAPTFTVTIKNDDSTSTTIQNHHPT